ncbi:SDR family NAD(P)-dependent oxidoreductase [Acetilactobacillus jinshanensis]|uniref:SDR family oxidoreductase n=1 Tax=Acetilactobacillus jinshanensis TaxID=1720083 RepID=A0A4V1ALQ6_9LACO|nr:SDR family NAD(P)-dependent oxidoreductase [Acetilactobacillus jinshanensis]QBP18429.1 SDR family oxidoreductase [Acetilactobacillus jinshanensis]URL61301.1 SDR family oxidoreductase [uncultured bacterium]
MFKELKNKRVLVVGSYRGIGKSIVDNYLNEGSIVYAADIRFDAKKYPKLTKINDHYYRIHVDVRNEKEIIDLAKYMDAHHIVPEIVIHVAGISTLDYMLESKTSDFYRNFDTNTCGFYFVAKYFGRLLVKHHIPGKIIVVDSQSGKNGYRFEASYCGSKHAILGILRVLALEIAKYHINVNAICPGIIETAMKHRERRDAARIRHTTPEAIKKEDISQVPLGRTGQPQDVANIALFLGSHLSDYMTGQAINITGGMTMH